MALLKSINVPLGTKAIDFCLKGIDGGMHSLAATELKTDFSLKMVAHYCDPASPRPAFLDVKYGLVTAMGEIMGKYFKTSPSS
ncbi:MAG: hypothetical protein QF757_04825 [Candidatus Marinimicrobia bacterium]|nr:hypothetical protein [Candidatus Neomarinimicrobiota bacterium]